MADITIIRGDTQTVGVTFTDSTGAAVNLTDCTVFFTVKNKCDIGKDSDDCALIRKTVTSHSDPTHGITSVPLTSTDTNLAEGDYYWDLQVKTLSNNISSTIKGIFKIVNDVTKRIT